MTLLLVIRTPLVTPENRVATPLHLDTDAQHSLRGIATTPSRVSRETLGVLGPVHSWSPHFSDAARIGAWGRLVIIWG